MPYNIIMTKVDPRYDLKLIKDTLYLDLVSEVSVVYFVENTCFYNNNQLYLAWQFPFE